MARYTLCPFFVHDKRKSRISCEDTYRWFDSDDEKDVWMDTYCDNEWTECPYAIELNEAYDRLEKGDEMALENHKIDALEKELKGMATKLGRAEKRIERQQKKIDELRAVNQSYINVNDTLAKQKRSYYEKYRNADMQLKEYERKIDDQIKKIVSVYEQRLCYLIENYTDGKIYEDQMSEWAGDKAMALVAEYDDGGIYWSVKYGEETKDAETDDGTIPGAAGDEGQEA